MAMKAKKTPNTYFIMRGNLGSLLLEGWGYGNEGKEDSKHILHHER